MTAKKNYWLITSTRSIIGSILFFLLLNSGFQTAFAADPNPNSMPSAPSTPQKNTTTRTLDQIVAIVNQEIITQSELDTVMVGYKQQLQHSNLPIPDDATLRKQVLDQLINQKLELQIAKSNQVKVTDAQVNERVKLIEQQQHMTEDGLRQALAASGLTWNDFLKKLKDQLTIYQFLQQQLASTITVKNDDVQKFLKQYQAQHPAPTQYHIIDVLVALPSKATPEQIQQTQNKAASLVNSMSRSANLQALASDRNGVQVQDLGWLSAASLPDLFVSHILKAKNGDVIGPLEAPNGFHVLKLVEVKTGRSQLPSNDQIKNYIFQQKMQNALQDWIVKARSHAYIRIIGN